MKKVNQKNLRAGKTIWYASWDWRPSMGCERGRYEVKQMRALSDKSDEVPAWIVADGQPRHFLRKCLADNTSPPFLSFSRRKCESWIKLHGALN